MHTERQTYKQTDVQREISTNRRTYKKNLHPDRRTNRQHIQTDKRTERQRQKKTEVQTDRRTNRQTYKQTEVQTDKVQKIWVKRDVFVMIMSNAGKICILA